MKSEWDGNNYQLWAQALIVICVICVICLVIDRYTAPDDGRLFGMTIFLLIIGIFLVPSGPKPPEK